MLLDTEQWNLLQELTEYNHMDTWFSLRYSRGLAGSKGYDFVRDLENNVNMGLKEAIRQVGEGLCDEDLDMMRVRDARKVWNGLADRLGLADLKVPVRRKGER